MIKTTSFQSIACMMLLVVGALSGCANKVCCPVDARELYLAPGEEAVRQSPCCPDQVMYGYRQTTWSSFPDAGLAYFPMEYQVIETSVHEASKIETEPTIEPKQGTEYGPSTLESLEMTQPTLPKPDNTYRKSVKSSVMQATFETVTPSVKVEEKKVTTRPSIMKTPQATALPSTSDNSSSRRRVER